jgi:hypothetical protein
VKSRQGHVDHAEDADDAKASGVDADNDEGEDVSRTRDGERERKLLKNISRNLEPRQDGNLGSVKLSIFKQ